MIYQAVIPSHSLFLELGQEVVSQLGLGSPEADTKVEREVEIVVPPEETARR